MRYCPKCNDTTERYNGGRCKPCHKASMRKWKDNNREHLRAYEREWRADHPNQVAEYKLKTFARKLGATVIFPGCQRERNYQSDTE
jgi:ferric-dicitrate binding protein FerR (iron transport regulator)